MRYLSDDGKVFGSEQECSDYEREKERVEKEEKIRRDKLEEERQRRFEEICQKRKELRSLTESYQHDYCVEIGEYLPFSEFLRMLYT